MPGLLVHSPAEVVRQLLIDSGLGGEPGGEWPVFATNGPDLPDNAITVYDTAGTDDGRSMDGERWERGGIQVRVRSTTHTVGHPKSKAIALMMDQLSQQVVHVDTNAYKIWTIVRTSDVLPLGKEVAGAGMPGDISRRNLFTVNALVNLREV